MRVFVAVRVSVGVDVFDFFVRVLVGVGVVVGVVVDVGVAVGVLVASET